MDTDRLGELTPSGVFFDTGDASGVVRPEPCALCGGGPVSLQKYMYVMSFLIFTQNKRYELLLCRACSTRQGLKDLSKSALLGWWGIPWGVMTFWALWVNTRTLFRWSTLAPVATLMLGVAGLLPPAAVGAWLYNRATAEEAAMATGDWSDEKTIGLVNEGHRMSDEGDLDGALESYRAAYARAPNSSIVNYSVANVLRNLGGIEAALPYAARAEDLNPGSSSIVALHGTLLLLTGDEEGARSRAGKLRGREPEDVFDAQWMMSFFESLGEYGEMLRATERGLGRYPEDETLRFGRIDAHLWLDQLKEAEALLGGLDPEAQSLRPVRLMKVILRMKKEPMAGLDDLLALWKADLISRQQMARVVGLIRPAEMNVIRSRVVLWLNDESTPGDVWFNAQPWFGDADWIAQLDKYLARRRETVPAMLRIHHMDIATENRRILMLADSVRAMPHPWSQSADEAYFDALNRDVATDPFLDELNRHLAENPSHSACRIRLCGLLIEVRFEEARGCLDTAAELIESEPGLDLHIRILRAEQWLVEGRSAQALDDLQALPPDAAVAARNRVAEAAFHSGRTHTLDRVLKEIGGEKNPTAEAPALLLRWSQEIVQGMVPTYDLDVDLYVKQYGDAIRKSESASAHAILVAEGMEERSAARRILGDRSPETFELVAAFKQIAARKKIDLTALEALAGSPSRGAYGARLARTIVEKSR